MNTLGQVTDAIRKRSILEYDGGLTRDILPTELQTAIREGKMDAVYLTGHRRSRTSVWPGSSRAIPS